VPYDFVPWLSDEPDPPMRWPISTRVNKPENDDPSIVKPIELSTAWLTTRYGFGVARPGALALLTFTALSGLCS